MPYESGNRLPYERASKLGHLDIIKSPLVQKLIASFEDATGPPTLGTTSWVPLPIRLNTLPIVFAVDGSYRVIESSSPPHKAVAFVKTALLRLDQHAISSLDRQNPHPFAIRDIMRDSAAYHATILPMRHVVVPGTNVYDTIRHIIFESIKDPLLDGQVFETLKWLAYEKWDGVTKALQPFACPHCASETATLPFDAERGPCPHCGQELLLTDMLGFHQVMSQDFAPDAVASDYMGVHETLLLFTGIRHYWENNRKVLAKCLFVKDGPLSIRAQYSKLVSPIRRFLAHARDSGSPTFVVGQEKTGAFADHLALIGDAAPTGHMFIPGNSYIRENIQHRSAAVAPYGKDTNYGAKLLVKLNERHRMVLNIPTGEFKENPSPADMIGPEVILSTLAGLTSSRFEGGLLPIELANAVASLSTYPSAQMLKLFADSET